MKKRQIALAGDVVIKPFAMDVLNIGGVDVAYKKNRLYAWVTVMAHPFNVIIDNAWAVGSSSFPYIPGFLSFREVPVIVKAFNKLILKPDLILVDGQGIAHPRGLGLASHLGLVLKKPTIGCAKSHLFGEFRMPGLRRGSNTFLKNGMRKIGMVLRTQDSVKPLFVSPGHLVDFNDCRRYVLITTKRQRIPDPIRFADHNARKIACEL